MNQVIRPVEEVKVLFVSKTSINQLEEDRELLVVHERFIDEFTHGVVQNPNVVCDFHITKILKIFHLTKSS